MEKMGFWNGMADGYEKSAEFGTMQGLI